MSATDSQLLHVNRKSVYQKRFVGVDNTISMPHVHSPLPKRSVLLSRRRHSTPQAATVRYVAIKSPQSNGVIKHYYLNTKSVRSIKDQGSKPDSVGSPPRPISLVKPRNQDERVVRLATTPTSMTSTTDIFLPIAKKNRTTIVETPSSVGSDFQSVNHSVFKKQQYKKRERKFSFDIGRDAFFGSDDDSSQDATSRSKLSKCCKHCPGKCFCRLSHINCYECYYNCPFGCWITCLLLALGLLIGIFITIKVFLR